MFNKFYTVSSSNLFLKNECIDFCNDKLLSTAVDNDLIVESLLYTSYKIGIN